MGTEIDDFAIALQLQAELDAENEQSSGSNNRPSSVGVVHAHSSVTADPLGAMGDKQPTSLVSQEWELLDPSPDVRVLFMEFNDKYFWGKLSGIEVRWSPKMTLCAGLCCYEGRGGLCSVRLSEPLLKLRPRKDLIETLLHEMIHAYLFVTNNDRDRDGHGPEFQKHMNRINNLTGTNITIYHTFHDEVDNYRTHWWKCDGPCVKKPPYFGIVKRAMNRVPSPRDPWWADHQRSCGGTYTKIKEPDDYGKKKSKSGKTMAEASDEKRKGSKDIRDMFGALKKPVENKTEGSGQHFSWKPAESPSQNTTKSEQRQEININPREAFQGQGHSLGAASSKGAITGQRKIPGLGTIPLGRNLSQQSTRDVSHTVTNGEALSSHANDSFTSCAKPTENMNVLSGISVKNENKPSSPSSKTSVQGVKRKKSMEIPAFIDSDSDSDILFVLDDDKNKQTPAKCDMPSSGGEIKQVISIQVSDTEDDFIENPAKKTRQNISVTSASSSVGTNNEPIVLAGMDTNGAAENVLSCPVCQSQVKASSINEHLDLCLMNS